MGVHGNLLPSGRSIKKYCLLITQMNPAIIGGLVLLIIIVVVAVMMMGGGEGSQTTSTAPAADLSEVTDPEQLTAGVSGAAAAEAGDEAAQSANEAVMEVSEEEEGEAKVVEVTDDDPSVEPKDVDGLVGHFTGDSWDEDSNTWKDLSGQGNDITDVIGTPLAFDADDTAKHKYVYGGKDDGFRVPQACLTRGKKYTFFHVSRYGSQNKADQHRIFDGVDSNNLSGFHNQYIGMAHRAGSGAIGNWWNEDHFMSHFYGLQPDDTAKFTINVDQKRKYRIDGITRTGISGGREVVTTQMSVNYGQAKAGNWGGHGERSVWNIGEMIFFDRELDEDDIFKIENYLFKKWNVPRKVYITYGGWTHNNWNREDGWSSDKPWGGLNNSGAACGSDGVMTYARPVNRHHYYNAEQEKWLPNNHFYSEAGCIENIHGGEDQKLEEKKGPIVPIRADNMTDRQKYQKLFNIDCKGKGINSYRFEKVGDDNMRLVYKCHNQPTIKESCSDLDTMTHGRAQGASADVFESLDLIDGRCHGKAVTKLEAYDKEDGTMWLKGRCCALEDLA